MPIDVGGFQKRVKPSFAFKIQKKAPARVNNTINSPSNTEFFENIPSKFENFSDVFNEQHALNYVMSNKEMQLKVGKCKDSKDLMAFLNKTTQELQMMRANSPQNK